MEVDIVYFRSIVYDHRNLNFCHSCKLDHGISIGMELKRKLNLGRTKTLIIEILFSQLKSGYPKTHTFSP